MDTSMFIGATCLWVFEHGFASGLFLREGRCCGKDRVVHSDLWPQPHFKVVIVFGWPLGYGLSLQQAFLLCSELNYPEYSPLTPPPKFCNPAPRHTSGGLDHLHQSDLFLFPPPRDTTHLHTSPSRGDALFHAGGRLNSRT